MGAPFVWFDLTAAADAGKVRDFYAELFGWPTAPAEGGYQNWLVDGGQPWAGMTTADGVPPGRWVPYVIVDDLDATTEHAIELGADVVRPRTTGPAGTSVIVAD